MRIAVLMAGIFGLGLYAFRDWFVTLCGLIVLSVVTKHPEMPVQLGDISGANPWNLLLLFVILGWAKDRLSRPQEPAAPAFLRWALLAYAALLVVGFLRGVMDVGHFRMPDGHSISAGDFTIEYLVDPMKYLVEALLLFDGLRSRRNLLLGLGAMGVQVLLLALLAIRHVPVSALLEASKTSQGEQEFRSRFQREIGLHANDAALVLVAGFWVLLFLWPVLKKIWRPWHLLVPVAAGATALALLLTNSRAGYLALVCVGLFFGVIRWRKLLLAIPVVAVLVVALMPNVADRISFGTSVQSASGDTEQNWDSISGGRMTNLWPPTLAQIERSPLIGEGRMTMARTAVYQEVVNLEGSCPNHPHNAYLEMAMDSGLLGLAVVLAILFGVTWKCSREIGPDPLFQAGRLAGLAGVATLAVMAMSGQSFWPREGIDTIICLLAILAGTYVLDRKTRLQQGVRLAAPPPAAKLRRPVTW